VPPPFQSSFLTYAVGLIKNFDSISPVGESNPWETNYDVIAKVEIRRQRKKIQMQGAQILRNEAYREVRCSDEG